MNKTPNYSLNQWEAGDKVQRMDFNADNAKLDAAIASVSGRVSDLKADRLRMAVGSYVGTGSRSAALDLSQSLGKPVRVLVIVDSSTPKIITWENPTSTTAIWSSESATRACNTEGVTYPYFALG